MEEKTIVIFTTDNGTNHQSIISHENGEYIAETVYSEYRGMQVPGGKKYFSDWGTRVPTLISWPNMTKPGSVNEELIDFSDFMPTLMELAGIPLPEHEIDGISFVPGIMGAQGNKREWVFSQKKAGDGYMVRTRDWKLLWDGRLYDMSADPYEQQPFLPDSDTEASASARSNLDSITRALLGQ